VTEPAKIIPYWAIPFIVGIGGTLALILLAEQFPALQVIYTVF
jgi:hypothetical protein